MTKPSTTPPDPLTELLGTPTGRRSECALGRAAKKLTTEQQDMLHTALAGEYAAQAVLNALKAMGHNIGRHAIEVHRLGHCGLCLLDGTVPSVTGGFDSRGGTVPTVDAWQQGVSIVTYDDDRHSYEHVEIVKGEAFMRGRVV